MRTPLARLAQAGNPAELRGIEDLLRFDLDHLAAEGQSTKPLRLGPRDHPAVRDEHDLVALLGLGDVLRRDDQRASGVAQPVELSPDRLAKQRVDPRRRFVEHQQCGIVDEGACELEPTLHPAREVARPPTADIPQVDSLQDLTHALATSKEGQAEEAGHEVDVLPGRQLRVEDERLGHVADPFPGPAPEPARLLAKHPDFARAWPDATDDHPDRGRLAGAGRADDAHQRSARDLE